MKTLLRIAKYSESQKCMFACVTDYLLASNRNYVNSLFHYKQDK